ncbi:MAG: glycoside hydrolase family 43 protein [Firmicutes bacterium]|nr:glycoside hydrolase family 43 protein [Bacillota bacterium]
MLKSFKNPIMSGFFPDPSIVRVEKDYYMVNSTFQYFPSIIISHSKDLVNWEHIGHVITKSEWLDLSRVNDSCGVWAADISYWQGVYYIFYSVITGEKGNTKSENYIVKSKTPEGPYSKPIKIWDGGFDPSHFIDDDGTHYMLINKGAKIIRLNSECTKAESKPVTLWEGSTGLSPEGPHLFKKDGYYYIVLAEGGTGWRHRITSARSKNLYGPYEESPHNPVLMQKDPDAPIQKTGHGKLFSAYDGSWWVVYLCSRPNSDRFCALGRETCLSPVSWTEDGWFIINEGKGPSEKHIAPDTGAQTRKQDYSDDFSADRLGAQWQFVRNPNNDMWSLTERKGFLRIKTAAADTNSRDAQNIILQRETQHRYTAVLKMEFKPEQNNEQAGLICYYGTKNYIKLCLIYEDGAKISLIENRAGDISRVALTGEIKSNVIYLRVETKGKLRRFSHSLDGVAWDMVGEIEDCNFLSDEGIKDDFNFTGTMVGMYANNGGTGRTINADFCKFEVF